MKIGWDYLVVCISMQSVMVLVEKSFHYCDGISHWSCHAEVGWDPQLLRARYIHETLKAFCKKFASWMDKSKEGSHWKVTIVFRTGVPWVEWKPRSNFHCQKQKQGLPFPRIIIVRYCVLYSKTKADWQFFSVLIQLDCLSRKLPLD
jgi:hypothetical protein